MLLYPFSPVRAIPRTNKRCVARKTKSAGMVTSTAAAIWRGRGGLATGS